MIPACCEADKPRINSLGSNTTHRRGNDISIGGKVASVTVVAPENDGLPCFTKWGSQFEPKGTETLADHNPIARGVAAMRAAMSSRDEPERFGQTACSHTGRVLCRSCGAEFDLPTGTTWEDQDDEWTDRIKAAHPSRSGSHEDYATAMRMVGARRSKGALVELVNYLLQR